MPGALPSAITPLVELQLPALLCEAADKLPKSAVFPRVEVVTYCIVSVLVLAEGARYPPANIPRVEDITDAP